MIDLLELLFGFLEPFKENYDPNDKAILPFQIVFWFVMIGFVALVYGLRRT